MLSLFLLEQYKNSRGRWSKCRIVDNRLGEFFLDYILEEIFKWKKGYEIDTVSQFARFMGHIKLETVH